MIPPVSTPAVPAANAGASADALSRLIGGGVAEARVVAITQAGLVKLFLDGLPMSAELSSPAKFAAGDRVALQRTSDSAVAIVRLAPGQTAEPSLFHGDAKPAVAIFKPESGALQSAPARPELMYTQSSPEPGAPPRGDKIAPALPSPPALQPPPIRNEAEAREALLPMARAAMATQTPLPDMFVRLQAELDAPDARWSPSLRVAIQAVLDTSFDPANPVVSRALRERVEGSGVFFESRTSADAESNAPRSDLKARLLTLRGMLNELVRAVADPGQSIASASGRLAANLPVGDIVLRPPPSASLRVASPPTVTPARGQGESGPITERSQDQIATPSKNVVGDLTAKLSALVTSPADGKSQPIRDALMSFAAAPDRLASRIAEAPSQSVCALSAGDPVDGDRPAVRPPLRGEAPPMQEAALYEIDGSIAPAERATSLLRDVDGALDRLRLLQFASLDNRAPVELVKDGNPARQWQVEIPLALPNGAYGALPLMIERDGARRSAAAGSSPAWRMRFTTETPELGAIDVAVTLRDGRIDVRFWADRSETASLIDDARSDLSKHIESEAAPVETIRCQSGRRVAPRAAPIKPGQFMDVQS